MDQVHIPTSESTARVPYLVIQPTPVSKLNETLERNPYQPPIPYPLRLNKEKLQDKYDIQIHKFLQIELDECMALADLGASINLMPLSVWKELMLLELLPTRMTLELANRSVSYPASIAEDVFVQVDKFMFPADFVTAAFLALDSIPPDIDNVIYDSKGDILFLETLLKDEPIVASSSLSHTPFGYIDFLLEETDVFLALDSIPPDIDNEIYDSEGDILFLESLLKDEPSKAEKSEINPVIREPSNTFLIGDEEIKFNPLKDIYDPVPIPRNEENNESEMETIMDEVSVFGFRIPYDREDFRALWCWEF
ncbi:reverse transcriptase domain-containing protein [Tanacetum coccineum]